MQDIYILNRTDIQTKQMINESIQELPVEPVKEDKYYQDYRPTALQFQLQAAEESPYMKIEIPYANRLTPMEAKYAIVCMLDEDKQTWKEIEFQRDKERKVFQFETNMLGIYAIFKNMYWYAVFTQELANEYPRWTRIRKTKESNGQRFLNFFGMQLEEIEDWLNWIDRQKHLATADIHVLDWIYVYSLPVMKQTDTLYL